MGQPNLIIPSRYLRAKIGRTGWGRPRQIVGVDPNHPCAAQMRFAAYVAGGTTVIDAVTGQVGVVTGSPSAASAAFMGASLNTTGVNTAYASFLGYPSTASPIVTLAAITLSTTFVSVIGTTSSNTSTSWGLRGINGATLTLTHDNNQHYGSSGITLSANTPYFLFASINTTIGILNYVARNLSNGSISSSVVTGATIVPAASNGTYVIGTAGSDASKATTAAFFVSFQSHSISDGIAWAMDPWGIFLQPRPARWVGKSAAAFLPAWALQRNTVNGGVAT